MSTMAMSMMVSYQAGMAQYDDAECVEEDNDDVACNFSMTQHADDDGVVSCKLGMPQYG